MDRTGDWEIVAKAPNGIVSRQYQIQLEYRRIQSLVRLSKYMGGVGYLRIAVRPVQAEAARDLLRGQGHVVERAEEPPQVGG